jgi:mannose-1-phosphate guanylyltransferase / phosphomannomutase
MKAVVMAGGEGSRLRPLTINRPKPMVPVVDRPVIAHIFELLKLHGITEVVVTVQYLANYIQDFFGDGSTFGMKIDYSVEETPLGTAGSVKMAEHLLDEPFVVISGDALTDFDLSQIIAAHKANRALATITLTRVANPLDYGLVIVDEQGRVQQFLEKPSWGEVFSDTVNTGIYVLDPAILRSMPPHRVVDWSKDVFPQLLAEGVPLYGHIAEGYWTDVGTIEAYMRACGDYMAGKLNLPRVGRDLGGGVWINDDVEIAPDAHLHGPIYLGQGVKIKSGVVINGPAMVRDYTIVDSRASIDRSLIWRNSYIGERAELRGAIVLKQCNIKSRAVLFEGSVIGDSTVVNAGAVIQPGVKIWPSKEVDEGATVNSSIIWGSQGRRVLFGRHGITGLVNIDITPEFCARLGAAYGAILPRGATVIVNRDAHYTPRMLKRAMISGLPSAGVNVADLRSVPTPVARFMTAASGAAGGVHVRLSRNDNRVAEIKFFDAHGLDIDTNVERKIENIFFREDFRRVYLDEVGRIAYADRVEERYVEAFMRALDPHALASLGHRFSLVVDYANANASDILPSILRRLNVDVIELNANLDEDKLFQTFQQFEEGIDRLTRITPVVRANLGARLDAGGERIYLVDDTGRRLRGTEALAAVCSLALHVGRGGTVAVPVTAPNAFEQIAQRYGGTIIRTRTTLGALMQQASEHPDLLLLGDTHGNFVFPAFHPTSDGLFTIVKLMELLTLSNTSLSEVVRDLPPYYLSQTRVPCRWENKGRVMRLLNEQYQDKRLDQIDGVKIGLGDEWVLILPDPDGPFFHVIAEGSSDARATILTQQYASLVAELQ